jgi:hypothetical protein
MASATGGGAAGGAFANAAARAAAGVVSKALNETGAADAINDALGKLMPLSKRHLLGGIPLSEVETIYNEMRNTPFSKQNIWHVNIESVCPPSILKPVRHINMYVLDVNYSPYTIVGDATPIGSGNYDQVNQGERVDMTITTHDNIRGDVKKWMKQLAAETTHADGTFGYPLDYLLRVTVTHAFTSPNSAESILLADQDTFIMRLAGVEIAKDRRNDAMEELNISFTQFDTFTAIL